MGEEEDSQPSAAPARQQAAQDLLADLFGGSDSPAATPTKPAGPSNDIMDLLGAGDMSSSAAPAAAPAAPVEAPSATAYDTNGLKLAFTASKDVKQANVTNLVALFTATEGSLQGINLQAAVPKVLLLFVFLSGHVWLRTMTGTDSKASDAANQQRRYLDRRAGEAATAHHVARRCTLLFSF